MDLLWTEGFKELFHLGLFLQRPRPQVDQHLWALHWVLSFIVNQVNDAQLTPVDFLHKTLIISSLVSRLQISQLRALPQFPIWKTFSQYLVFVSLAPALSCLAKNEGEDC